MGLTNGAWSPNMGITAKSIWQIMDVGGWKDPGPAFALVSYFLWPWASCNHHWPGVALMVTSKFEIFWLCHEINWHIFPEGIYNLLGDNRQATISQLEKPWAESLHGRGTWRDLWRGEQEGRNILPDACNERSEHLPHGLWCPFPRGSIF